MPQSKDHDTTELSDSLDNLRRKKGHWDDLIGNKVKPDKAAIPPEPPSEPPSHPDSPPATDNALPTEPP